MSPDSIKKAIFHLKKDEVLARTVSHYPKPDFKPHSDHFGALVSSIIYQQITGRAAETIQNRFKKLFKNSFTPKELLGLKLQHFKNSGISPQKQKYLIDLAEKFLDGTVNPDNFHKMTDEEIRAHLIAVKGIGRWTADMFLMFTLVRLDVLPTGDLGIQKGFQKVFNMKKLPSVRKMEQLAKNWSPYKTFASWYLWRVADKAKEK